MADINAKGLRLAIKQQFLASRRRWLSAMDAAWFDIAKGVVKHLTSVGNPLLFLSSNGEWLPPVGSSGGNAQRWSFKATGAEGVDFFVDLPATRSSDHYIVQGSLGTRGAPYAFAFPRSGVGDRQTTKFRVTTAAPVAADDTFDFVVTDED